MSRFRKVDVATWGDARFTALSQDAKFLWLYLLTGPHVTSLPGLFAIGRSALAEALGWSAKRLDTHIEELTAEHRDHRHPMVKFDWKSRVVWLPNAAKHNRPTHQRTIDGWRGHWSCIPECELKREAARNLAPFLESWGRDYIAKFNSFASIADTSGTTHDSEPGQSSNAELSSPLSSQPTLSPAPSPSPALSDRAAEDHGPAGAPGGPLVQIGGARCDRMCDVFVEALAESGWPRGPLRERWERQALCDAINAHLRADETIDGILAELRRGVGDWVEAKRQHPSATAGWGARKFKDWLAEGRPQDRGLKSTRSTAASDSKPRLKPPSAPDEAIPTMTPDEAAAWQARIAEAFSAPPKARIASAPDDPLSADEIREAEERRQAGRARRGAA